MKGMTTLDVEKRIVFFFLILPYVVGLYGPVDSFEGICTRQIPQVVIK